MLLNGSGIVLIRIRRPALTPWLASAVLPEPSAPTASLVPPPSWPAISAPSQAPIAGRTKVCTVSQALST